MPFSRATFAYSAKRAKSDKSAELATPTQLVTYFSGVLSKTQYGLRKWSSFQCKLNSNLFALCLLLLVLANPVASLRPELEVLAITTTSGQRTQIGSTQQPGLELIFPVAGSILVASALYLVKKRNHDPRTVSGFLMTVASLVWNLISNEDTSQCLLWT